MSEWRRLREAGAEFDWEDVLGIALEELSAAEAGTIAFLESLREFYRDRKFLSLKQQLAAVRLLRERRVLQRNGFDELINHGRDLADALGS